MAIAAGGRRQPDRPPAHQGSCCIPRFDRRAQGGTVLRLAQESLATLTGLPGFDAVPSHDQACEALLRHCTDPQAEVLEYLRRDVANLALLNKDTRARNTAVQRDFKGQIVLTPLYDFAPMYLHPDGIARRIRWEGNDFGRTDWTQVVTRVCEIAARVQQEQPRRRSHGPALLVRTPLVAGLKAMAPALREVATAGEAWGLEPAVAAFVRGPMLSLADELAALR